MPTILLRVTPRAKHNAITGRLGEAWKIGVTAPAEAGRANAAVLELLAETLHVRPRQLILEAGDTGRNKRVTVTGLTETEVVDRLTATLTKS